MILIVVLFLSFQSFSQHTESFYFWPFNNYTQKIDFNESVNMPNANADTLFNNARAFITAHFRSQKDTILVENDTTNTIICKGAYFVNAEQLGERGKGYIGFTLSIECRYNSYRYSFSNFEHYPLRSNGVFGGPLENETAACGGRLFPSRYWNEQKAKCYYMVQTTIEQLKEAMNKNTDG
jgi:hypothetical protein